MRGKTHLTGMNAETKLSTRGQVVIPKDIRDALHLSPGQCFSIRTEGRRIVLDAGAPRRAKISHEEFRRRMPKYEGPPIAVEDMNKGVEEMFRDAKF